MQGIIHTATLAATLFAGAFAIWAIVTTIKETKR
jgi:hypothetical protein